jgi:hypothetical protein
MSTSHLFKLDPGETAPALPCARFTGEAGDAVPLATMQTSIGTLAFRDGVPTKQTAHKVYDNLDLMHSVDAFLKGFPGVALHRLREAQRRATGPASEPLRIFFSPASSKLRLMAPKDYRYEAWSYIDLENNGPAIIDFPPTMVGVVDDMWSRIVEDLGPAGPDGGRGGKYLLLPPCYQGRLPLGYTILRPRTNGAWVYVRRPSARLSNNTAKLSAERLKIYSLTNTDTARAVELVDGSRLPVQDIAPNDHQFFEDLDQLVQTQPSASLDRNRRSLFASIGIVKGRPFHPNLRMKSILADAVAIGCATIRAMSHYSPDIWIVRHTS